MNSSAFDPGQPFRSAEALTVGITRSSLRGPSYRRLLRDCYVASQVPVTEELMARAALAVVPKAYGLSDHSAAAVLGLPVPRDGDVHLAVPAQQRTRIQGVRLRRCGTPPRTVTRLGLPVTLPERVFIDLAESLGLVDLVILGDALVRKGLVTPEKLAGCAAEHRGRGAIAARRAADLVRGGVDSPMETRLRLLLVLAGLPEPVVNHEIRDCDGLVLRRLDLAYPEAMLAIEYDGRHHIERERQWRRDLARREDLEGLGWRFVVVVSDDVYAHPGSTLTRVVQAMRRTGMAVPQSCADWRTHFPGRAIS